MQWQDAKWFLLCVVCLTVVACNNDNISNEGVIGGGGRFALVVEPARTSIDGTHFLVDTATGALWVLKTDDAGRSQWTRIADAPRDVQPLTLMELLGATEKPRDEKD
jgi:hypothetical protein